VVDGGSDVARESQAMPPPKSKSSSMLRPRTDRDRNAENYAADFHNLVERQKSKFHKIFKYQIADGKRQLFCNINWGVNDGEEDEDGAISKPYFAPLQVKVQSALHMHNHIPYTQIAVYNL
jgi:hypothetical protein